MSLTITLMASGLLGFPGGSDAIPEPVPFVVQAGLPDAAGLLSPSQIHIGGWLGARIDANEKNRLLTVDTEPLLAGYRKRPGSHPWIGEHVGKWLHAATLAWAYTGDTALKSKLDRVAAELIACQEPDGYLGTYVPEKRFGLYEGADWDVWSHKYNLIGLLTYYQYTGNRPALDCCRKMADLLIATFPAKKSILAAGTHVGMAATSVLEPVVLLYRFTGDKRYLEFAQYIVKSWDEPGGPAIVGVAARGQGREQDGQRQGLRDALEPGRPLRTGPGHRRPRSAGAGAKRLEGHRREPSLYHRQRQRGRGFPGRSRPAQPGRCAHLRDLRHDDLDPAQPAASATDGRSRSTATSSSARSTTIWLPPSTRAATTGATTRLWKERKRYRFGHHTAVIPAAHVAWFSRCRPHT